MRTLVEEIRKGNQVRQQFIALKESLKEASDKDAFLGIIHYDMDFFRTYLNAEDPKVRKNVIQIIGILELSQLTDDLIGAYLEEQTQFLKAEYVKVLGQFDVSPYIYWGRYPVSDDLYYAFRKGTLLKTCDR